MPLHALDPPHARLAVWRRRVQVVPTQDMTHRQLVDRMPEMRQGTLDPSIAQVRWSSALRLLGR